MLRLVKPIPYKKTQYQLNIFYIMQYLWQLLQMCTSCQECNKFCISFCIELFTYAFRKKNLNRKKQNQCWFPIYILYLRNNFHADMATFNFKVFRKFFSHFFGNSLYAHTRKVHCNINAVGRIPTKLKLVKFNALVV